MKHSKIPVACDSLSSSFTFSTLNTFTGILHAGPTKAFTNRLIPNSTNTTPEVSKEDFCAQAPRTTCDPPLFFSKFYFTVFKPCGNWLFPHECILIFSITLSPCALS